MGVGKTTVSAVLARAASLLGLKVLIVEVEGRGGAAKLFGLEELDYHETVLSPAGSPKGAEEIRARSLTPDAALTEYLEDHGLKRITKRLVENGAIDLIATSAPGIKDILILGKIKALAATDEYDLIIVDAPASGHAITFLRSASALLDAVSVGPVRKQATDVAEMLSDETRCRVQLVALGEETPINELIETAFSIEEDIGVALMPVIVNAVPERLGGLETPLPAAAKAAKARLDKHAKAELEQAGGFRRHRNDLVAEQLERLTELSGLAQLHLPFRFDADLGPTTIDELAHHLTEEISQLDASLIDGATP